MFELPLAKCAPLDLARFLADSPREGQRLVLSPTGPASLAGLASTAARIELLIGPEGGLDDAELAAATRAGFAPVRLGPVEQEPELGRVEA